EQRPAGRPRGDGHGELFGNGDAVRRRLGDADGHIQALTRFYPERENAPEFPARFFWGGNASCGRSPYGRAIGTTPCPCRQWPPQSAGKRLPRVTARSARE